jgi:hypothetical protein
MIKNIIYCTPLNRLTPGIRIGAVAPRATKNTSRANALCGVFSPPHCQPPQTFGLLYKGAVNVVYLCTLYAIRKKLVKPRFPTQAASCRMDLKQN